MPAGCNSKSCFILLNSGLVLWDGFHYIQQTKTSTGSQYKNYNGILTVGNGVLSEIFAPSIDVCRQHLFHDDAAALIRLIRSEAHDAEILQRKTK